MTDSPRLRWRKSTHSSDEGECVEVAAHPTGTIAIRDSKNPDGPHLALTHHAFRTLLDQATTWSTPNATPAATASAAEMSTLRIALTVSEPGAAASASANPASNAHGCARDHRSMPRNQPGTSPDADDVVACRS